MASTTTFRSFVGKLLANSNVSNAAGAPAYAMSAKHALAQYAATGCFNATYYVTAEQQLDQVIALAYSVEPSFLAKTAIFSRERGAMKDMPALLCAALSIADDRRQLFLHSNDNYSCRAGTGLMERHGDQRAFRIGLV